MALAGQRTLLVLDGIEPLQHGPGPQIGQLKDPGLRALLRRFAAMPPGTAHGLIVLTSRLAIKDIGKYRNATAPVVDLEKLSDEAGAALFRDNGVGGTDAQLQEAARDFGGHPLALALLATLLKETQGGDVRRRDHIRRVMADAENPGHDHARRVMESYETEWLSGQPILSAIMDIMGLFDRPADGASLRALRATPIIEGLTDAIVGIAGDDWQRGVSRLRDARLLAPMNPAEPNTIDAHPLIRDWFGERLRMRNEGTWRAAHGRLYEHLRDNTKEGPEPNLEQLGPLYEAIAHGCRAGRHQEALDDIYTDRLCGWRSDGKLKFYSVKMLGAMGTDLAAIAWFFDRPYETPTATLETRDQSWVLNLAASGLRSQGRLAEALPAQGAALRMVLKTKDWQNAAVGASNLSEAELLIGDVASAVANAARSVEHADRSGVEFQIMARRTTHASALHAAGQRAEAEMLFVDAESRQREHNPDYPLLYSLRGYHYCDFLLGRGEWIATRDRATKNLEWEIRSDSLLDRALVRLALGRAYLALAFEASGLRRSAPGACTDARTAQSRLDEAVDGLRGAGTSHHVPKGLLTRTAFHRSVGDRDGAARDLDEVEEIAEPGPMKLYLCDMALERARLAFARIEAFAPLNGLLEVDPPKPTAPNAGETKRLADEAKQNLATARGLIESCGYHRRDEGLAELEAVLRGEKHFADLPPRV